LSSTRKANHYYVHHAWQQRRDTLNRVFSGTGCCCAAATHATGKRELLEDLTYGAAARESLEEPGDDIPGRQVWTGLDRAGLT
jgi:hypothetical protein